MCVKNSSLPHPVDLLLVLAQQVFPLDYVLYSVLVSLLNNHLSQHQNRVPGLVPALLLHVGHQ